MADTAFTVKVDDRTFVLDRITIGDWRMFKTEFGLKASDIVTEIVNDKGEKVEILNLDDPNVLVGLMVAALHHERPHAAIPSLIAEVEALGMEGLEFPDAEKAEDDAEADPTKAGDDDSAATAGQKSSGKSATRRKKPGAPS
jgi:predicted small lipoprotein YifL